VRRTLQVIALLAAILFGSVPGLRLLGSARPEPCPCCAVPTGTCPCPMPDRAPGPATPCAPCAAPVAALAAPWATQGSVLQAVVRAERTEPSPVPRYLLAAWGTRLPDSGPSTLARPSPVPPFDSGPARLAKLTLLRI